MTTIYAPGLSSPGIIARATARDGKTNRVGWCLFHQLVDIFKVPGVADYDRDGDADCLDYWKAAKKRGTVVETTFPSKIPVGALVIWGTRFGHAATYLGNGKIMTTDATRGRWGITSIDMPRTRWGHDLLGYVVKDGNGFTLLRAEPTTVEELEQPALYSVRANGGLKGHDGPSIASKQRWLAKDGGTVKAVAIATGEGRKWAVTKNGVHYALDFLVPKG